MAMSIKKHEVSAIYSKLLFGMLYRAERLKVSETRKKCSGKKLAGD